MHIDRYLKNGVSESNIHVTKHANFSFKKYTLMKLFRKPENWWKICEQTSSTFNTSTDVSL